MSEYSDILYDFRQHTHVNCIKEVPNCDMLLLIIGSRFGGTAVPSVRSHLDFDILSKLSTKPLATEDIDKLSITQLEVLKAIEQGIPTYVFVDSKVFHDHHVYERNKEKKEVLDQIEFPSIQKKETAKYIFEFINFISHRLTNNSLQSFTRLDEIKGHVLSQWSQLFQRMLMESRTKKLDEQRYLDFSNKLEDLKVAILASITTPNLRSIAHAAIEYRRLIQFICSFVNVNHRNILLSTDSWSVIASEKLGIKSVQVIKQHANPNVNGVYLLLKEGGFYELSLSIRMYDLLIKEWERFIQVDLQVRETVVDAIKEEGTSIVLAKYHDISFDEYLANPPALDEQDDIPF